MISRSTRVFGRRQLAVLLAAFTAFGAFAAYRSMQSADAHETTVDLGLTCPLAGALTVTHTVSHTPTAGAVAGELFTISDKSSVALAPTFPEVGVTSMKITIPIPAGVTSGGEVHLMGGTFTKGGESVGAGGLTITLTANPGTTSKTMSVPELMIPVNIPAGAAGQTIAFAGPSTLVIDVNFMGNPLTETCTANPGNPPLVSTVVAPGSTATTAGPTTTSGGSVTTAPATTAPVTTAPVTTAPVTTRPGVTTRPATTAPPTTMGHDPTEPADPDTGTAEPAEPVIATPHYTG